MVMLVTMLTATLWYGGKDSTKNKTWARRRTKEEEKKKKKEGRKEEDSVRYKPRT